MYPLLEPDAHGMLEAGDGHRVYWETWGAPDGKPALCLHGGPGAGCPPWWRRLFDPQAYRVVLFDSAWRLAQAWATSELVVIEEAGHKAQASMIAAIVAATDRFARRRPADRVR